MEPTLILAAIVVAVSAIVYVRSIKKLGLPPGPHPIPVFGNLLSMGSSLQDLACYDGTVRKRYGDVHTLWMGSLPVVMLHGYEAIHSALVKNADKCSTRFPISFLLTFLSDRHGVVLSPHWKEQRKFTLETLKEHGVGRDSLEVKVHEELTALFCVLDGFSGSSCEIRPHTQLAIANIVSNVVFGRRFEYIDERFNELVRRLREFLSLVPQADLVIYLPLLRFLPGPWGRLRSLREPMLAELGTFVSDQQSATKRGEDLPSFIGAYLKLMSRENSASAGFTEPDLLSNVLILFGAATDTTDATLRWMLLYCLVFTHVQRRLQQEIDDKIGRHRYPSIRDRQHMPYAEAFIAEVLRVASPAPIGLAYSVAETMNVCGLTIPAGSVMIPNLVSLAFDEAAFPDPLVFKPERHIDENGKFVKPNIFPFSTGRRSCPGEALARMELFLFLTSILQRYEVHPSEGGDPPEIRREKGGTVVAPYNFTCRFIKRSTVDSRT